jgi:hypothetical protein
MHRLVFKKEFFIKGFFRPLSDVSLYLSYLISGLKPFLYNFFNLFFHIICSYLLYRVCLAASFFHQSSRSFIAWSAALLFLIYPYHNESIVWIAGRGSIIACFFAFLSLHFALKTVVSFWNYLWPCIFYFIGLAGYETVFPLPAIVLILLYQPEKPFKKYIPWLIAFSLTLLLHLLIRYKVSGVIWGSYGGRLFSPSLSDYLMNLAKVFGRSFLPPSDNSYFLSTAFVLILVVVITALYKLLKNTKEHFVFYQLTVALALSYIIPVMFGVSTHTFEGDRLLYFSSFFLTLLMAFCLSLVKSRIIKYSVLSLIMVYFVIFLFRNNASWIKAGQITTYLINKIKTDRKPDSQIGIINLPQEYNGAFIFRNGFKVALWINHVDSSSIHVFRTLMTEEVRHNQGIIIPKNDFNQIFIPPNTIIEQNAVIKVIHPVSGKKESYQVRHITHLYYWNKSELIRL